MGPGVGCPVCGARRASGRGFRSSDDSSSGTSATRRRTLFWAGGGGLVRVIAAALLTPVLVSAGFVALLFGAALDIGALVTAGLLLSAAGMVLLMFVAWKVWRGIRGATRLWYDLKDEADDVISGRWERVDGG